MSGKVINRQAFALNLGFIVTIFHIVFSALVWFILEFPDDRVIVKEISAPVTAGYVVGILKYYLDTKGIVTSKEILGIRLVALISLLVGAFCISLLAAPLVYLNVASITADNLNSFFLFVESAFGALIALIFSFLYGAGKAED